MQDMYHVGGYRVKDLVLVQAIVEQGTLSAAARHLGLSQPALSRQLADAERRLECLLFVRQGRSLRLAPAGQRLVALAPSGFAEPYRNRTGAQGLGSTDRRREARLCIIATSP